MATKKTPKDAAPAVSAKPKTPSIDPLDRYDDDYDEFDGYGDSSAQSSSSGGPHTFEEDMTPRYRKIALNGLPIRDGRPQDKPETDEDTQETYIDALNFSLRHDTSDLYIPLVGGAMSFSVKRKVTAEVWSTGPSLQPQDMLDRPFGHCWTASSLVPNVRMEYTSSPQDGDKPDMTVVTDENGQVFRFFNMDNMGTPYFIPIPSNNSEQDNFLATLTADASGDMGDWTFTLAKKYGTTLSFEGAGTASYTGVDYYYYRCTQVADRYGNTLAYSYSGDSPVPESIDVNGSRTITITANDSGQITQITDPLGTGTTVYTYGEEVTVDWPSEAGSGSWVITPLVKVERGMGGDSPQTIEYAYTDSPAAVHDPDNNCWYLPYNLIEITTDMGGGETPDQTYQFDYVADMSYMDYNSGSGWYVVKSLPMIVSQVTLPTGTATFTAAIEGVSSGDGMKVQNSGGSAYLEGTRKMTVVDAAGKTRTYEFQDSTLVDTSAFQDYFFYESGAQGEYFHVVRWGTMVLTHPAIGEASPVTETYTFKTDAAMGLGSVDDYSENTTSYDYDDDWDAGTFYSWMPDELSSSSFFYTAFGNTTQQTDALGSTISFEYTDLTDPTPQIYRILTTITEDVDVDNGITRETDYEINTTNGLCTKETIKLIDSGTPTTARETTYVYDDPDFDAFMTSKTITDGVASGTDLVVSYTSDDYGYVGTEVTGDPGGTTSTTTYVQDENGNRKSVADPLTHTTMFDYDFMNRLITVNYPDTDNPKSITYDPAGNKASETAESDTGGSSQVTNYEYDSLNRLTKSTQIMGSDPDGYLVTQYEYNAVNSRTQVTDSNGNETDYTYDEMQRLTQSEDALSGEWDYVYSSDPEDNAGSAVFNTSTFNATSTTAPGGIDSSFEYDKLYRMTQKQAGIASSEYATTNYEYDDASRLVERQDYSINPWKFQSDALNRLTQTTAPDYTATASTYTPAGLVLTETDQAGSVTTYEYDAYGRRTDTYQPDPSTGTKTADSPHTQMVYDLVGNLLMLTNPLDYEWAYTYDSRNRKLTETHPDTGGITNTYDAVGNVLSTRDANMHTTSMAYDQANRLVTTTYPGGATSVNTYDLNGNVTQYQDENGNNTYNTYDDLNQLLNTSDDAGRYSSYLYDGRGNRIQVTDANSCITQFTYDGLNRLLTTVSDYGTAAQATVTNDYGPFYLDSRTDGNGQTTYYYYDALYRLQTVTYPTAVDSLYYTRDALGNILSVTHPYDSSPLRNVSYTYDKLSRLLTETSAGATQTHTYDKAGNRLTTVYAGSSRELSFEYDPMNRMTDMSDSTGTNTIYTWDLNGNRLLKEMSSGLHEERTYDDRNRLTALENTAGAEEGGGPTESSFEYTYDAVGNVLHISEVIAFPGGSSSSSSSSGGAGDGGGTPAGIQWRIIKNQYDQANRLIGQDIERPDTPSVYTQYYYDGVDNRTGMQVSDKGEELGTSYVIGNGTNGAGANQIVSATLPDSTVINYTYDGNGSRITKNVGDLTDTYSYDLENRLVELVFNTDPEAAGTYDYAYDYRTRRVSYPNPETGTMRVSFIGGTSAQEYEPTYTPPALEYIRGPGQGGGVGGLEYSERDFEARYNQFNGRGDVVGQVDQFGSQVFQAEYEAFGTHPVETGNALGSQRANTKEEDPTGLLNEGFRYRDLDTGTFITRDPLGFKAGPNMYTFVGQNPWSKFDPQGLQGAVVDGGDFSNAFVPPNVTGFDLENQSLSYMAEYNRRTASDNARRDALRPYLNSPLGRTLIGEFQLIRSVANIIAGLAIVAAEVPNDEILILGKLTGVAALWSALIRLELGLKGIPSGLYNIYMGLTGRGWKFVGPDQTLFNLSPSTYQSAPAPQLNSTGESK